MWAFLVGSNRPFYCFADRLVARPAPLCSGPITTPTLIQQSEADLRMPVSHGYEFHIAGPPAGQWCDQLTRRRARRLSGGRRSGSALVPRVRAGRLFERATLTRERGDADGCHDLCPMQVSAFGQVREERAAHQRGPRLAHGGGDALSRARASCAEWCRPERDRRPPRVARARECVAS
jgi:hypothetical protein